MSIAGRRSPSRAALVPSVLGGALVLAAACAAPSPPASRTPGAPAALAAGPAPAAVATQSGTMAPGPSQAAGNNLLWNGSFDGAGASLRPWSLSFDSEKRGHRSDAK